MNCFTFQIVPFLFSTCVSEEERENHLNFSNLEYVYWAKLADEFETKNKDKYFILIRSRLSIIRSLLDIYL